MTPATSKSWIPSEKWQGGEETHFVQLAVIQLCPFRCSADRGAGSLEVKLTDHPLNVLVLPLNHCISCHVLSSIKKIWFYSKKPRWRPGTLSRLNWAELHPHIIKCQGLSPAQARTSQSKADSGIKSQVCSLLVFCDLKGRKSTDIFSIFACTVMFKCFEKTFTQFLPERWRIFLLVKYGYTNLRVHI